MTRIAFIGDAHIVYPHDIHPFDYEKRKHYIEQYPFVRKMLGYVNSQKPDYTIFMGDVVDWYSPENIDFALELISELKMPWAITPGNHDYQLAVRQRAKYNNGVLHEWADFDQYVCKGKATEYWNKKGIYFESKKIDVGEINIYLVDSALGFVPMDQENWLANQKYDGKVNILATHVPIQIQEMAEIVSKNKATANLDEYVQSESPHLYNRCIKNKIQYVMMGHVHFPSITMIDNISFQTVTISCLPGKKSEFAGVSIIDYPNA